MSEEDAENQPVKQLVPLEVQYCEVCSLPPEFCCFGDMYMKGCRDWAIQNYKFEECEKRGITKEELLEEWDEVFNGSKKKLKVANSKKESNDAGKMVTIKVNNRGKHRYVTEIHGLGHYTDIKGACKDIKKKFACAATVVDTGMKGRKSERNQKKQNKRKARDIERQNRKNRRNGLPIQVVEEEKTQNKPKVATEDQIIEAQGDISPKLKEFISKKFGVPMDNIK